MKTAMQELIDNLIEYGWLPNDASNLKQSFLEPLLEKEKEQIIDACNANLKGLLTNGKDYYDLNFNHHIQSESNSYINFKSDNANVTAGYNDSLKNFTPNQNK
jgi:hypothetical protein